MKCFYKKGKIYVNKVTMYVWCDADECKKKVKIQILIINENGKMYIRMNWCNIVCFGSV